MVHRKALAMDNLNSSSIILPRASSHLQHQPHSQHRRNNSLRMWRLFKNAHPFVRGSSVATEVHLHWGLRLCLAFGNRYNLCSIIN